MAIHKIKEIEHDGFRMEPMTGLNAMTIRRDFVEPVPVGSYVVQVFKVVNYGKDCDGSALATLAPFWSKDEDGFEYLGEESFGHGLEGLWHLDHPDDLDKVVMDD